MGGTSRHHQSLAEEEEDDTRSLQGFTNVYTIPCSCEEPVCWALEDASHSYEEQSDLPLPSTDLQPIYIYNSMYT